MDVSLREQLLEHLGGFRSAPFLSPGLACRAATSASSHGQACCADLLLRWANPMSTTSRVPMVTYRR